MWDKRYVRANWENHSTRTEKYVEGIAWGCTQMFRKSNIKKYFSIETSYIDNFFRKIQIIYLLKWFQNWMKQRKLHKDRSNQICWSLINLEVSCSFDELSFFFSLCWLLISTNSTVYLVECRPICPGTLLVISKSRGRLNHSRLQNHTWYALMQTSVQQIKHT